MALKLPNDKQRLTIVGRTGSGKTQAAAYHLSLRSWDKIPWIVYDYKIDELLNGIKGVHHIDTSEVPQHPGIYLVHPHPDDTEGVHNQMRQIWERGNIGVYIDEGYMICNSSQPNPPFRTVLTQGRSLHIPVIILSQRPVWLDRFVWTESDFYQIFALNDFEDRKQVRRFAYIDVDERLPEFWSWYYNVKEDKLVVLKPVPQKQDLLDRFAARMATTNRRIFV